MKKLLVSIFAIVATVAAAQAKPVMTFDVKGVKFNMIKVEHGTFTMGATPEMKNVDSYESFSHQVTLSRDYYIGETEVTQALWKAVMGTNPSRFKANNLPVENLDWNDCQKFVEKLSSLTGKKFRLPTEAEWEYAARGGNKASGHQFMGSDILEEVAWFGNNSGGKPHPVASKKPNELGLYDMAGNVWEWCSDFWSRYRCNHQIDPTGPESGEEYVCRGGDWESLSRRCRASYRDRTYPDDTARMGLRIVLVE
ncbi:MAG: formylglycine-generating enzyme family protein [Bacteroidales bacterium]|nr:formylglycine-generating enzyme family protein [Candidatus Sodaliphilus aphodohippi]